MTDSFITVTRGGPGGDNDIPDGVYPLILTEVKDPRVVTAQRGVNAGKDISLIDWIWAIDWTGNPLDGRVVESSTSIASGPKSKMYAYLTALFNGTPPPVGTKLQKTDLEGRRVLGTVTHDEDGWVRLANVSALPPQMVTPPVAAPSAAPVAPPAAVAAPVAATAQANDLPF